MDKELERLVVARDQAYEAWNAQGPSAKEAFVEANDAVAEYFCRQQGVPMTSSCDLEKTERLRAAGIYPPEERRPYPEAD